MGTSDQLAAVRAGFVTTEVVTARQWAEAAAEAGPGAGWQQVLAALAKRPAWWAVAPGFPAVTPYHLKLAAHLVGAGAVADIARKVRWNRHLILTELGRGGMGVVCLGWDTADRRLVALKRVRSGGGSAARSRFRREARVLARLDHPGIAKFLGVETVGTSDVLVMEFVAGEPASRRVRRLAREGRHLPWEDAVGWTVQVLAALSHAHARGVVHRDIKPGNVMVPDDGRGVKLLDVGLAKAAEAEVDGAEEITRDGQALGTRAYMPPEQWAGKVSAAADLYALGCTLYHLLAGGPPYPGDGCYEQMRQHTAAPVPSVRKVRPDVPAELDEVVRRMMAKNPADRGTARELKWLLERVTAGGRTAPAPAAAPVVRTPVLPDGSSDTPRTPPWPTDPSRSRPGERTSGRSADTMPFAKSDTADPGVRVMAAELAGETARLVRRWAGRPAPGDPFDVHPWDRVKAVGGDLGRALWDGLRGRRPDARRPARAAAGLVVLFIGLVAWLR